MKKILRKPVAFVLFTVFMTIYLSCASIKTVDNKASLNGMRPGDVSGLPICTDCHKDKVLFLDHTPDYILKHKFNMSEKKHACEMCHNDTFCSDCHSNKEELKPSDKFKDSPGRSFPHRGDYITKHKIDGRVNPTSCIKCHGRKNNERCKSCHK